MPEEQVRMHVTAGMSAPIKETLARRITILYKQWQHPKSPGGLLLVSELFPVATVQRGGGGSGPARPSRFEVRVKKKKVHQAPL